LKNPFQVVLFIGKQPTYLSQKIGSGQQIGISVPGNFLAKLGWPEIWKTTEREKQNSNEQK